MSAHDEDETDAGVRRPARHEARLHHQEHQRSAIGAPPRPSINMPRLDSAVLQRLRKRRIAVLLNGLMNSNGTKNGDCSDVCSSPGLRFARVTMRCRGWPRGFAERQLFFSRQLTLRPTRGATRQLPLTPHTATGPYLFGGTSIVHVHLTWVLGPLNASTPHVRVQPHEPRGGTASPWDSK